MLIDERDELEALLAELESVADEADGEVEAHSREASDQVASYLDRPPSLLLDGIGYLHDCRR